MPFADLQITFANGKCLLLTCKSLLQTENAFCRPANHFCKLEMPFADLQITFANGKCQKLSAKAKRKRAMVRFPVHTVEIGWSSQSRQCSTTPRCFPERRKRSIT